MGNLFLLIFLFRLIFKFWRSLQLGLIFIKFEMIDDSVIETFFWNLVEKIIYLMLIHIIIVIVTNEQNMAFVGFS